MDKIYIKNYTVQATHGYYKEEHYKSQRFVVSIIAYLLPPFACVSDDLKETFNYEYIRKIIDEVLHEKHHNLVESLAEAMARRVLQYALVEKVEVEINKPDVWGDCLPGVCIVRDKKTHENI